MAGVAVMISKTGTVPPVHRGHELLAHHGLQHKRQLHANLALLVGREGVDDAVHRGGGAVVCRVENRSWAISAAVIAVPMVSWSRISPSRMTSGASRIALRSASA